jgi:hypothetical protein
MTPSCLQAATHSTQTVDWMARRRKFMLKCDPDTTYSVERCR